MSAARMRFADDVEAIARTVLFEGYALFPYRASALKNARRMMFGSLAAAQSHRVSVLCRGEKIRASLRFLQATNTQTWDAVERAVDVESCGVVAFDFDGARGTLSIETSASALASTPRTVALTVANDVASRAVLESVQVLLRCDDGEFATGVVHDEGDDVEGLVCSGLYPVFVGGRGTRSTILCAPFVLDDWPAVARESKGDAFDGSENDALLSLSIQALSDDEKRQMAAMDPRTRALLEQANDVDGLLEGAWRERPFKAGDAVVLRPNRRADVMDLALAGKAATVVAVDVDVDDRVMVSVTVDDDPGKDLGLQGHRFFFFADEVERR